MKTHIETLTEDGIYRLLSDLKDFDGTPRQIYNQVRYYVMVLLMLDAGLRVGELIQLRKSDLLVNSEPVNLLRVRSGIAKGNHGREIYLTQRMREAILLLQKFCWQINNDEDDIFAFFCTNGTKHITVRQVERILKKTGLDVLGHRIKPHTLRHTFATRLMRRTNIRTVQALLGHKSLTSTQIYTHPNNTDMQNAINSLED